MFVDNLSLVAQECVCCFVWWCAVLLSARAGVAEAEAEEDEGNEGRRRRTEQREQREKERVAAASSPSLVGWSTEKSKETTHKQRRTQ